MSMSIQIQIEISMTRMFIN